MNTRDYEKIKDRIVRLVKDEDRLDHEWNTRIFRGYLVFLNENAYYLNSYLPLDEIKKSFADICPEAPIPDDCDLGSADPERSSTATMANEVRKWLPQEFQPGELMPDVITYFQMMDAKEIELILSLLYVFHLVEDTLREHNESFTMETGWGEGEETFRMLFLDIFTALDPEQNTKQSWSIIEGIYAKTEDYRFVIEPWMEWTM